MRHFILAGLMAATAFTPISSAMAAQLPHYQVERRANADQRDHARSDNNRRATMRIADRDDRRGDRLERRNDRRGDRSERRVDRRDSQRNWRETRHDNRHDARRDRRDDRHNSRIVRRDDRHENRRDWRENRRDDHRNRVTNRWSDQRRWSHNWRNDRRYDWRNYRQTHRHIYRSGRYYAPRGWNHGYSRFSVGIYLGGPLYSRNYWIDDPWYYRLPPAYGSMRWIRYYDDALLIDIRDGYVVDVIYNFFD